MSNYFLRPDALAILLDPRGFAYDFLDGRVPDTSGDRLFRRAELSDVILAIVSVGDTAFTDEGALNEALFSGPGGGMGIPIALRDYIRAELVVEV